MIETLLARDVPLKPFVSLRTGGPADLFCCARNIEMLCQAFNYAVGRGIPVTIVGQGSNILPSDDGVEGLVIVNACGSIAIGGNGTVEAETGCILQDLFLKTAQSGLSGLEFAVGIPGTLGGALASNAGAYRSSISEHIVKLEICEGGEPVWVDPAWMEFSYRHSKIREAGHPPFVVTRVRFIFPDGDIKAIYRAAKDYQLQRISKQPPPASAGSFFKNVNSHELALSLPSLPKALQEAGVVPAGYLIEGCGLKGFRHEGAQISSRHANFIVNSGGASATSIRELARIAQDKVRKAYGVEIEEEVLYIGRWDGAR